MNTEALLNFSRKTGISVQKVRRALSLPHPSAGPTDLVGIHRRYDIAPQGSKEEHDAFEALLHACKTAVRTATTVAEAKIAYEYTPSADPLKIESLNKWRQLSAKAIEDCTHARDLQSLLFLIPPDTEEEFAAIRKLASLLKV